MDGRDDSDSEKSAVFIIQQVINEADSSEM
jgi:hypothetical protein